MGAVGFIAKRYLLARKSFSFINIISLLAMLGIAFGVAALIVVMSVFNGFGGLVTRILQDFDPHLKIERTDATTGMTDGEVEDLLKQDAQVHGFAPYVERKAMATARGNNHFIWIKGLDGSDAGAVSGVTRSIVLGSYPKEGSDGILLGSVLADRMRVQKGDSLIVMSPLGMENILTQYVVPTIQRCVVSGIFDSKNKLYDGAYGFLPLSNARRLLRADGGITGYEVRFDEISRSFAKGEEYQRRLGPTWRTSTWFDLHKDLYSVMRIERWSAFLLVSIIIVVAVFSILASLTMLVLEKQRDIGILRTMGMTGRDIQRMFVLSGMLIGGVGIGVGLVLGLSLCWIQESYGLFTLNAAFIIPALPVEVDYMDVALIVVSTFLLTLVAVWIPARRARAVSIMEAIRWE